MGTMPRKAPGRPRPTQLRKETRDWLQSNTIPNARKIAHDLENAGEDVRDLLAAIDELEGLLRDDGKKSRPEADAGA
jgi:hypothetical protein